MLRTHHNGTRGSHPRRWLAGTWALLILPVAIMPQEFSIKPVAFIISRSTGDWWQTTSSPVTYAGAGLRGEYTWGRWRIESEFFNTRFYGLKSLPDPFTPEQGLSWSGRDAEKPDVIDTDYTAMKMTYATDDLSVQLGKYDLSWGPGYHSLTLSSKPPAVPRFGFDWQVLARLKFMYSHSQLNSRMIDAERSAAAPSLYLGGLIIRSRYLVAHRLELALPWGLTLGGSEAVVYGDREVDLAYLLPFISYWSAQHFLGDRDNTQISVDLTWRSSSGWSAYAVFLMDEWRPRLTFAQANRNWFGYQAGIGKRDLLREDDRLRMEVTWTDHRIYRHRFPVNDFYSHNYPVGHWAGPHAQTFAALYQVPVSRGWGQLKYIWAKRGQLTNSMVTDQYNTVYYERFSGEVQTLAALRIAFYWPIWQDIWVEAGISSNRWENPGFDPRKPDLAPGGIADKWSLNLGIYTRFSLQGYDISDLLQWQRELAAP